MADESQSLSLTKPIPPQIVNEGAAFGPLNLTEFIESNIGGKVAFRAELSNDQPLPQGLICLTEGLLSGIAGENTQGTHKVIVVAVDEAGGELRTEFLLTINPRMTMGEDANQLYKKLKAEIWEALGKDLPLPEFQEILNRPITATEIYHLLQRFGTLTIWDVYNLDYPGEKKALQLAGMSKHYNIYDRGCCIVGCPKDLFSNERTQEDAIQTAKAMAKEVYKRGWVIEFAGFDKMVRAAWVELQVLGDKNNKHLEILHYTPTPEDLLVYQQEAKSQPPSPSI